MSLNVRPDGALDFVSLGALVHRLDPGLVPFRKATTCAIHVSGGEFNCAANLADCFRMKTAVVTAMVDYPVGDLIAERVRAMGVKAYYKHFAHDGVRGPNMALVYSDRGHGIRGPVVFYNRSNEAAAQLKPGDFEWKEIFGGGVRWFHSGGIFASLSPTTSDLIIEGMEAAKKHGAVYLEAIFSPIERTWRGVDWDEMFTGYCDGAQAARELHGVEVRLTPDITRSAPLDERLRAAIAAVEKQAG